MISSISNEKNMGPEMSQVIHKDIYDIENFLQQISTWNQKFIDVSGDSHDLDIDAINSAFTNIEKENKIVNGMIVNAESYASLRLLGDNVFSIETDYRRLCKGIFGHLFTATYTVIVYVRKIVPKGHFFLFSDTTPDNLIRGFRFAEIQKQADDVSYS